MPPVRSGDRPPHLIAPDEVADWLLDSVNGRVTYHRTSEQAARDIVRRGVDVSRSRIGSYGQGFYTATETDPFYGPVEIAVAIRLTRPLQGDHPYVEAEIDAIVQRLQPGALGLSSDLSARVRRELMRLGYDGLMIADAGGDGIDYVVALEERTVKVLQP
jgi:hypothetical protein